MQRRVEDKRRGRGSARVEDRGSESFPRHASFLTTVKLFLRLPVTGAPLFEFSPHPSHLTRVLSVPTLLAPPPVCHEYVATVTTRLSKKKKKMESSILSRSSLEDSLTSHYSSWSSWFAMINMDSFIRVWIRNMRIFENEGLIKFLGKWANLFFKYWQCLEEHYFQNGKYVYVYVD